MTCGNFRQFCMNLWAIPTQFDDCLSNYECLKWLFDQIEKVLKPAVLNNAEGIDELKKLYEDLKVYVDTYFDSLDIQKEIDMKLEAMAQSGELANIIAQFLELQSVMAFKTADDLSIAENLHDGEFVRTFGLRALNDGKGDYYFVRPIRKDDVIDDVNIIDLVNAGDLVAEVVKDKNKVSLFVGDFEPSKLNGAGLVEEIKCEDEYAGELPISNTEAVEDAKKTQIYNLNNNMLKVGTWNIENENVPYKAGLDALNKINKVKYILNKMGCSITAVNEYFNYVPKFGYNIMEGEFLKNYEYWISNPRVKPLMEYGEAVASSLIPTSHEGGGYVAKFDHETQGYIKAVFQVNGHTLSFYSTHLCYNNAATLKKQAKELYNKVASDPSTYKIIAGDFNFELSEGRQYIPEFLNAGYKQVNGGKYTTVITDQPYAIDEILVSPNIEIVESGAGDKQYIENQSDHYPVWATVKFL